MKKFLALLLFLLFIVLAWFSWQWYKNNILCCPITSPIETKENVTRKVVKFGPLVYDWNSEKPITSSLWPDKKNEIQGANAEGKILRIVGPYYKDEINNTSFENLGLARADAVRQILSDSIVIDRMEIDSKLIPDSEIAKIGSFGGTILEWKIRNENIQEVDNKTLVYFPHNSTKKMENENISNYLKGVADNLKSNEKTVSLTGHTDNKGRPGFNMKLGLNRAKAMKKILVSLGVASNRISVGTEGENNPIASNDTEEGMQKNRRVELEIK